MYELYPAEAHIAELLRQQKSRRLALQGWRLVTATHAPDGGPLSGVAPIQLRRRHSWRHAGAA